MKKLFMSVAVLAFLATPALAGDYEGKKGPKMDTDGDGVVSKSEFMAKQEARFDEMDANNDGKIQKEEFKAMKDKWKDKRKEWGEKRKGKKKDDSAE
jgi:predicted small lipoprotein YifL